MNIVETDYWCLLLPPEWSAEQEEDTVCITDQDGIGELALTALIREQDDANVASPAQIARQESPEVSDWVAAAFGEFSGVTGSFQEEGSVVQEWYLGHGPALLYCTYVCASEDEGMDVAAVEEILGTLVPGDALLEA